MVDIGPLFLHALLAGDTFSPMLPEQVPGHVGLVAIGYAALVAVVVELVFPDVHREFGLVSSGFETHLARKMTLSQVHHQPE